MVQNLPLCPCVHSCLGFLSWDQFDKSIDLLIAMNQPVYPIISESSHTTYEFFSEGPKGIIKKLIIFQKIAGNFFNLSLLDYNKDKEGYHDTKRSNNSDRNKVLSTVALAILDFTKFHPKAVILIKGSTPSRTRLYQMAIAANLKEINNLFSVEAFSGDIGEPFKKGKNYDEFIFTTR